MRGRFDSRADDPLFFGAARRATVPRWVPMDVRLEWGHGGSPSNGEASATPRMIEDPCPHHMRYCSLLVQALRNADDGRYSAWRSRSFGWPLLDEGHLLHRVPRHILGGLGYYFGLQGANRAGQIVGIVALVLNIISIVIRDVEGGIPERPKGPRDAA